MTREEQWNAYLSAYADYEKSLLQIKDWATAFATAGAALGTSPLRFSFDGLRLALPTEATTGRGAVSVDAKDWTMPKSVMEELQRLHSAGQTLWRLWGTMAAQSRAGLEPPPEDAKVQNQQ